VVSSEHRSHPRRHPGGAGRCCGACPSRAAKPAAPQQRHRCAA